MINVDQLLQKSLETLFAAFFNADMNKENNFEIQSNYRETKFLALKEDSYRKTAEQLTKKYDLDFKQKGASIVVAEIQNNRNYDLDNFLDIIYETILTKLNALHKGYDLDSEMALAMFIFRGSADFNRGLYAVDLKNPTQRYVDNLFKLLLSSDELLSRLNLNFRELQPQYIAGSNKRNTQIRINLKWFYDNVITKNDNINQYKTSVLKSNILNLGEIHKFKSFEDRMILYRSSILGRELTSEEINILREDLHFNELEAEATADKYIIRNQKIVSYARETFEDVCVGCGDVYGIEHRSFLMPRNNRYYFEVNHVIAYANDTAVDVLDNLVKLCPTCHRALTPGRAYPKLQKEIIEKMVHSRNEVEHFVNSMMPTTYTSPVDYVYDSLR